MDPHAGPLERIILAFLTTLPPTIMAAAALVAALRAARQSQITAQRVDGRVDQLLEAERNRARLEGVLEAQADASGSLPPARPSPRHLGGSPPPRTDPNRP